LLPGEVAPRLGLALCLELDGDLAGAAQHYEAIWRTDHAFVSAAFGLARAFLARGDRAGAAGVLDCVPPSSSHHFAAQLTAVGMLVRGRPPAELSPDVLFEVGARFDALGLNGKLREDLAIELLSAALTALPVIGGAQAPLNGNGRLLGAALTEQGLRQALESAYRRLARLSDSATERVAYVDRANSVRPRTLI
jgi:serine/threonine-protein kinase PknG